MWMGDFTMKVLPKSPNQNTYEQTGHKSKGLSKQHSQVLPVGEVTKL